MKTDLVCLHYKKTIKVVKNIAVIFNIVVVLLLLGIAVSGGFEDAKAGILASFLMLLLSLPLLIPGFLFEKVSQSVAELSCEEIRVLDKKGRCWRVLPLDSVTDIRVQEIEDFFYGQSRYKWKDTYICFYLHGADSIPDVSYHKLFQHEDFFLISYDSGFANHLEKIRSITKVIGQSEEKGVV